MHRIDHATKDVDLFGSGKHGFTEGTPGTEAATVVTDDWLNGVQEEICNVIEDVGITLVKGTRDQQLKAIKYLIANRNGFIPVTSGYGVDSGGNPTWYLSLPNVQLVSLTNNGDIGFPVNLMPGVTQDITLTLYVKPGAARSGYDRVHAGLYVKNLTGGNATLIGSIITDDGTTNGQNIVVTNTSITPTIGYAYYVHVQAGNTGAASPDILYSIRVEYDFS